MRAAQEVQENERKKLRGDMKKAQEEAGTLTSEQILDIEDNGKVVLAGHEILMDELFVNRTYIGDSARYEASGNRAAIVLIDTLLDDELILGGVLREVLNRVQRLRKQAGLVVSQKNVQVYYSYSGKDSDKLDQVFAQFLNDIQEQTGTLLLSGNEQGDFEISSSLIGDSTFDLQLKKPE